MRAMEWRKIERSLTPEKFAEWLDQQPESAIWLRGKPCLCVLHAYVESATGHNISINSPVIAEHWAVREDQEWPTPWWVTWYIRSVDALDCGESHGWIGRDEARAILAIGMADDWRTPLESRDELVSRTQN